MIKNKQVHCECWYKQILFEAITKLKIEVEEKIASDRTAKIAVNVEWIGTMPTGVAKTFSILNFIFLKRL